jgi:hypothetical protein
MDAAEGRAVPRICRTLRWVARRCRTPIRRESGSEATLARSIVQECDHENRRIHLILGLSGPRRFPRGASLDHGSTAVDQEVVTGDHARRA